MASRSQTEVHPVATLGEATFPHAESKFVIENNNVLGYDNPYIN